MITDVFYRVGQEKFNNRFLAEAHAQKTHQTVKFDLFEQTFDQCNWMQEPTETWDHLLDIRANQLRNKNKPLVLFLSGGTDSYTIYEVFKRNNITLDAIYIRMKRDHNEIRRFEGTLNLVKKDLEYTATPTKLLIRYDDIDLYRNAYNSETWTIDKSIRFHFSISGPDVDSYKYVAEQIGTEDFIPISGLDKPRLFFDHTGVYSYQDDINYGPAMTSPINCCFYIDRDLPKLHIKQSYLLLNYIRSKHPYFTQPEQFIKYNKFHDATEFDWLEYSLQGCGRFGDVNLSTWQHFSNVNSRLIIPKNGKFQGNEYHGRSLDWFNALRDDVAIKNYLAGLQLVFNDPLTKSMFSSTENFYSVKDLKSKLYKLNFNNRT